MNKKQKNRIGIPITYNLEPGTSRALRARGLPAPRASRQAGMTFLEVLVSVAVFVFAILAIVSSVQYFYKTNVYAIEQASQVSSAQRGLEQMVKSMREAAYASNGAYPVVSMSATQFAYYADVDSDPLVEKVRYYVQGNFLYRGIVDPTGDPPVYTGTEATSTVSEYVHNVDQNVTTFRYYDKNGVEITDYAKTGDVRFISMTIVVNVDPNRLPNQLTMRSSAALRNLIGK